MQIADKMQTGRGSGQKIRGLRYSEEAAKLHKGYTCDFLYCDDAPAQKVFDALSKSGGRLTLERAEVLSSDRGYSIERYSLTDRNEEKGDGIGFVEARREGDGSISSVFVSAPPRVLFSVKKLAE